MEKNEISLHEVKVFEVVRNANGWITNNEIAEQALIAPRTARAHTFKLVQLGVFDVVEVFPAHKFKLSEKAGKRNQAYMLRIQKAKEAFGLAE
jgi:hypothetical protein